MAVVGGGLVTVSSFVGSGYSLLSIPFILWALVPYAGLLLVSRWLANPWLVAGAGLAALAVEAGIRAAVFVYPTSSTAAIALVFSPAAIAVVVMPIGAIAGAIVGWISDRSSLVVRVPLWLASAALLALTFIAFARPELFPTAVVARRAALADIGEPRVVTGGDRFTRVQVSDRVAWHQTGNFDEQPGDELARIDHAGVELIDPDTLAVRTQVPFGGRRGGLWNWFSRLQRLQGRLVVVQSGGGYQETEVRSLDDTLLWRYRPDPTLAPSLLWPADADADGEVEFYAATASHVARLDGAGREQWRRPAKMAGIVDVAPRTAGSPAWIVASEYESTIHVWDAHSNPLAALGWPGDPVLAIVDWPAARHVVVAGARLRGLRLDGSTGFDFPVGEHMRLQQAAAIRWSPDAGPMLALVTSAPEDVGRWRLRLLAERGDVVYDEVLDRGLTMHVARSASGRSTLFISGEGLWALRPVDR